jgi:hypothetical protein
MARFVNPSEHQETSRGGLTMIEVNGMQSEDAPLLVTFDGKFVEIFSRPGLHCEYIKIPVQWIKKMETRKMGGRVLNTTMKFPGPVGFITFVEGGENLDELVDAVNAAIQ